MGQGTRGRTHKEAAEIILQTARTNTLVMQTARTNTLVMQIHVFQSPKKKEIKISCVTVSVLQPCGRVAAWTVSPEELLRDTESKLFSSPRPIWRSPARPPARVSPCGEGAARELTGSGGRRRCPGGPPAHSLARFQKYTGTRVDPFLMNSAEGKGHRFVSLPHVLCPVSVSLWGGAHTRAVPAHVKY